MGDGESLLQEITHAKWHFKLPATTPVRSCDEAGRDGFWPHRLLEQQAVQNPIVDSSSITAERRVRAAKTIGWTSASY